tara:strand:+ start:75 stop:380 length:306 start_codon:yes stop_codon:yes gene_type:complete
MKHLFSKFKIYWFFIGEIFAMIFLPCFLAWLGWWMLFYLLAAITYFFEIDNFNGIYFSKYGFALGFIFACYFFYEIIWKKDEMHSAFSRLKRDLSYLNTDR